MKPTWWQEFWDLFCQSFPKEERRVEKDQLQLLELPVYELKLFYEDSQMIGFCAMWHLPTFLYIEHFAYHPSQRGKGLGTQFIQSLLSESSQPLILEVEQDIGAVERRRIQFYERLGMHLNRKPYLQPPLQPGTEPVPMFLFSWPNPLNKEAYQAVKSILYREVYRVLPENPANSENLNRCTAEKKV